MRTLLAIILVHLCLLASGQNLASRIDSLNSIEEVEAFYFEVANIPQYEREYLLFVLDVEHLMSRGLDPEYFQGLVDSLDLRHIFIKHDFDKNGFTDLLLVTHWDFSYGTRKSNLVAIMNDGKGSFRHIRLNPVPFADCIIPILKEDDVIEVLYNPKSGWPNRKTSPVLKKTYVFQDGKFFEHITNPPSYDIQKVVFESDGACFGRCSIIKMTLKESGKSIYKFSDGRFRIKSWLKGVKIKRGRYTAEIDTATFDKLRGFLNYLDFPRFQDFYYIEATDLSTYTLTITYNNGQVKKISTYSQIGPPGLLMFYDLIFDLQQSQKWKRSLLYIP